MIFDSEKLPIFLNWTPKKYLIGSIVPVFKIRKSLISLHSNWQHIICEAKITINVPLFKKLRDIIFFCGTVTL